MSVKYSAVTNFIEVSVSPSFLEEHSLPSEDCYLWAYDIQIRNLRPSTIQLLTHKWRILDVSGVVNEINGLGVVGQQPIIRAGEVFQYASGTYLNTPTAMMQGEYEFIDEDEVKLIIVNIPTFSLDSPYDNTLPN